MGDLCTERFALAFIQLRDVLQGMWRLCDECTLAQQRKDVGQTGLGSEFLDIGKELFPRDARES